MRAIQIIETIKAAPWKRKRSFGWQDIGHE